MENEGGKLPRFSYQVPADLTAEFVSEMKRDRRETPSDLLTAIVRKYFEELAHASVVERLKANESLQEDERRVPRYGVKPSTKESESDAQRKASQE